MHKIYLVSLGCPKNFVDTELIAGKCLTASFEFAQIPDEADIYFINTCAFIPDARDEAVDNIDEGVAWKAQNENRLLVVAGCLNQWDNKGEYRDKYPEVDLWLGIDAIPNVAEHIEKALNSRKKDSVLFQKPQYLYDHTTARLQLTPQHYAYVKIAEGCDHNCSYCSIPRIRGKLRRRNIDSVLQEVKGFVSRGVKEIILIAQDTTFYGDDLDPNVNLTSLIEKIDDIDGEFWVRIMYTHPASFPESLIKLYKNSKKLLPYIDIPLQHIADDILESMGRKISSQKTMDLMHKLRREIPNVCIRTTFIVGYPGESVEDFNKLYEFCKEFKFDRMGAFIFQPEPFTRAYNLKDRVPIEVATERMNKLMTLQQGIAEERNLTEVANVVEVIIDEVLDNGVGAGRTYKDAPNIDNVDYVKGVDDLEPGDLIKAEVQEAFPYDSIADFVQFIR
jgi:ribosomal protein S12 methylthiotransferase